MSSGRLENIFLRAIKACDGLCAAESGFVSIDIYRYHLWRKKLTSTLKVSLMKHPFKSACISDDFTSVLTNDAQVTKFLKIGRSFSTTSIHGISFVWLSIVIVIKFPESFIKYCQKIFYPSLP